MNTFNKLGVVILAFLAVITYCDAYTNPIFEGESPDPYIYLHTDGFYYYVRSNSSYGEGSITVYKSKSLTNWRGVENQTVYETRPPYGELWAPEIHFIQGNWYIYFALDTDGNWDNHRMYVIKALDPLNPLGEYTEEVRLIPPTEDYWAIDGTVLQYDNGTEKQLYFIWSGWPELDSKFPQNIYIAPMSNPMELSGNRVVISEPLNPWEISIGWQGVNEGPEILQTNGRTFIVFSASSTSFEDYCLGIMGIDNYADPLLRANWWKNDEGCVFYKNQDESVYTTGHASMTTSPDGKESFLVYHATDRPDAPWTERTARAERFYYNFDYTPAFPRPTKSGTILENPSGQQH